MIKNIVFDFGGVIADLDKQKAVEAFKSLGIQEAEKYLDPYLQSGAFLEVENGKTDAAGFIAAMQELSGRELSFAQVQNAWLAFITGISRKKLDYILSLRDRHYNTYLLSNTNPFIMDWACSERFPWGLPLDAYFDKMYFSYKAGFTKPDERIFKYMLEDSGIKPDETLFVEDGKANIDTAGKLGFRTYCPLNGEDWRMAVEANINK
ncbi:MAG: HAD family phosphatase [Bacteroidetes bacterium]|uniref:HAD family phosphatase n=1 Tax=Candidatus Merdivivens pullistercoris TaxID=2840873 RepID=A0A9D9I355_9BACT|nr:HAD family phosphatase [Candidatus Merdivivens pullistercoris]